MEDADLHSSPDQPVQVRQRAKLRRVIGLGVLGLFLAGVILWSVLAIKYSDLPASMRPIATSVYGIGSAVFLVVTRRRRWGLPAYIGVFALLVVWWLRIPSSNDRDWLPDVAVLPYATIEDNRVTIHNIRNCDYRTETDFDVRHYDRQFDLNKLNTADLYVVYWGSPMIAHTMLSFGFQGDEYVCISIETRKEKGETYSALRGFFKQYELTYVVADERDLVRLRTNYRGEDVYLYRLRSKPEVVRKVFLDYLRTVNSLKQTPVWYNAATQNCTTTIGGHTQPYAQRSILSWKMLINGYVDEMVYENGAINYGLPFAETKAQAWINDKAKAADQDPAFSKRIRAGLSGCD